MKELVEHLARALVDHPEDVVVEEAVKEQATVLTLRVAASDLGKVIGRQGRTARNLRTIVGAAGFKRKRRAVLDIQE